MPEPVIIIPLREGHLDAALVIERESFPDPWSRKLFENEISAPHALCVAALAGDQLIGYCTCWIAADECTINRLAVADSVRREGIASALLRELLNRAADSGAKTCYLEVRSENHGATCFYEKVGFRRNGVRKNYYRNSGGDALLMSRPMDEKYNA